MALSRISSSSTFYTNYLYYVTGDGWQSYSDGMVYNNYCWGAITGVSYNSSTRKIDVSWKVGTCYNNSAVGGYYLSRLELSINGSSVWNGQGSAGSWYSTNYMVGVGTYEAGSGTTSITWNGSSSQSISISVKAMYDWGYSDSRWNSYDTSNGSGSYTTTNLPTYPSGSISVSNIGRQTANYSSSISAGNGCSISKYAWSISPSATLSASGSSSGSISNLTPNTNYTLTLTVTNSASLATTKTYSFTTTGNAPNITGINVSRNRTSTTLTPSVSYDTNDDLNYYVIQYSSASESATTINNTTGIIDGLSPNTTYYYNMQVVSTRGRYSDWFGGTFTTTCNLPTNLTITRNSSTTNSISVTVGATGDTNAPITGYKIYYQDSVGNEHTYSIGTNTTTTISNLNPDENYTIYFMANNAAGSIVSEPIIYSTLLPTPNFIGLKESTITPFTYLVTVDAIITPTRDLTYSFGKNGEWSDYQESPTYYWDNLEEETEYIIGIRIKAIHESVNASDTTTYIEFNITTPSDQAKIYVKAGDGATNHPAIDGYQPIGGITASSTDQRIVLKEGYNFANTTAEITMKWNDINTVQNIGSNRGGYFGVANGYYTFMGQQTQRQAIVDEIVTVRLVSTLSHTDPPELSGGVTYYNVSCYINNELIAEGEGQSYSAVPLYFYFYLFGCYGLSGSTATIYQAKYFDKTYLPYRNIETQELVFINKDKEITGFNNGTGIAVPNIPTWKKGKSFFKLNNQWKKIKKIYIKKPDIGWVIGVNEEKD